MHACMHTRRRAAYKLVADVWVEVILLDAQPNALVESW